MPCISAKRSARAEAWVSEKTEEFVRTNGRASMARFLENLSVFESSASLAGGPTHAQSSDKYGKYSALR